MTKTNMAENEADKQSYELGFLLSPLVAAEQVEATVTKLIKDVLQKIGAQVEREEGAKMITLAYPIKRVVDNKGSVFREAYFGVIYFQAIPDQVVGLEGAWQRLPELVRHILIKRSPADIRRQANRAVMAEERLAHSIKEQKEQSGEVDKEAIDKEIEGLLAEAK